MSKLLQNPHPNWSIDEVWRFLQIVNKKPATHCRWHLTKFIVGQIHAVPNIHGTLIATDGVQCIIVREDGKQFLAHIANFVAFDKLDKKEVKELTNKANKFPVIKQRSIEEYL